MNRYTYLPEPHAMALLTLSVEIEKGSVKIPQFQRDFVWTKQKSAELLDSVLKGYPIGTFILLEDQGGATCHSKHRRS